MKLNAIKCCVNWFRRKMAVLTFNFRNGDFVWGYFFYCFRHLVNPLKKMGDIHFPKRNKHLIRITLSFKLEELIVRYFLHSYHLIVFNSVGWGCLKSLLFRTHDVLSGCEKSVSEQILSGKWLFLCRFWLLTSQITHLIVRFVMTTSCGYFVNSAYEIILL